MSNSTRILLGLAAGLVMGSLLAPSNPLVAAAQIAGEIWLDGLRMTIIPLVFSLIASSVSSAANLAATRGAARKALTAFAIYLTGAAAFATLAIPAMLAIWPPPQGAGEALRIATGQTKVPAAPPLTEWLTGLLPENVFRAAADGVMLQLVLFALIFGFAATRIAPAYRDPVIGLLQGIGEIMMVIVGWVLWIAPIGVFGLAITVGANTGLAATGALAHYVLAVSLMCIAVTILVYPVTMVAGRIGLLTFAKAVAPAQAVAASTQSSLASLPAMLTAAQEKLAVPKSLAGLVIPLGGSLFRVTSPAANLTIAYYIAAVSGIHIGPAQMIAGALVAIAVSIGVAGVASQASFFASGVPICAAMGVPVDALAILIAVETIPDIFRTIGNVTGDLSVATILARRAES